MIPFHRSRAFLVTMIAASVVLTGCGALKAVQDGRAVYQGYQALGTAHDMSEARPAFEGSDTFRVDTEILPRSADSGQEIAEAFDDNMVYLVERTMEAVDLDVTYCEANCPSDATVVQFREGGYGEYALEEFAMGDTLRGEVFFLRDGSITDDDDLRATQRYTELFGLIQGSVGMRAVQTKIAYDAIKVEEGEITQDEANERAEGYIEAVNALDDAVKPEYAALMRRG